LDITRTHTNILKKTDTPTIPRIYIPDDPGQRILRRFERQGFGGDVEGRKERREDRTEEDRG
jgi:hypothetical protein